MTLDEILKQAGARKRRKRVGRGEGSGWGKNSTRGNKGALSRSGGGAHPLHEGGQAPIYRRLPKRGFSNFHFRTEYSVVNLDTLDKYFSNGDTVDTDALKKHGLLGHADPVVKVLARGELGKKLSVIAHAISGKARAAIEKAGGSVKLIGARDAAALAKAKRNSAKNAAAAAPKAGKGARGKRNGKAPA